jgi:hypothetical protein
MNSKGDSCALGVTVAGRAEDVEKTLGFNDLPLAYFANDIYIYMYY